MNKTSLEAKLRKVGEQFLKTTLEGRAPTQSALHGQCDHFSQKIIPTLFENVNEITIIKKMSGFWKAKVNSAEWAGLELRDLGHVWLGVRTKEHYFYFDITATQFLSTVPAPLLVSSVTGRKKYFQTLSIIWSTSRKTWEETRQQKMRINKVLAEVCA